MLTWVIQRRKHEELSAVNCSSTGVGHSNDLSATENDENSK